MHAASSVEFIRPKTLCSMSSKASTTPVRANTAQSQKVWPDHDGYAAASAASMLRLTPPVTSDDQVKAYIKKIMSQLKEWMYGGKISKLVVVITSKETGEHVERWQFDVCMHSVQHALPLTLRRFKSSERMQGQSHRNLQPKTKTLRQSNFPQPRCDCMLINTTELMTSPKTRPKSKFRPRSSPSFDKSQPP